MAETIDIKLLHQLFPSELMEYFDIVSFRLEKMNDTSKECWLIDFDEKNILPTGYTQAEYESKGFMESKRIQDFPLRGKAVFLRIRKRRWRNIKTGAIIKRDFTFISEGAKFTKDLSDFLKDRG
jgi:hypothetical protein